MLMKKSWSIEVNSTMILHSKHGQITSKLWPEVGFETGFKFYCKHFLIRMLILDLQELFKIAKLKNQNFV